MLRYRTPKILNAEHFLESANDSVRYFRNVYLAYLTVMIYIFAFTLSIDQYILIFGKNLTIITIHLNYIGVPIIVPIVEFFTWMPLVFLIVHFYLLIQVMFLSEKVHLYRQALYAHLRSRENIRKAQMLLAPMPLIHTLVEEKVKSKHAVLLYPIVFVSLVLIPLMVLIFAQITFLPYQNEQVTWVHRIVILIDVSMLLGFGYYIFRFHKGKVTILIKRITGVLGILVLVYVFIFINFPDSKNYSSATADFSELEWVKEIMPINYFDLPNRKLVKREPAPELLAAQIKKQMGDEAFIKTSSSIWCQYADPLDLRDRNFRKAKLQGAIICQAILQNADFTDADLRAANLAYADLRAANLTDAYLGGANLAYADLRAANLTDAYLGAANLTDAYLRAANLTDAYLREADLTAATLGFADLTDANLEEADLVGADLTGADLSKAYLGVTDLTAANLSQADFSNAALNGTILDFTWIWESSFPVSIPRGQSDTLKPEYLCPRNFDTSNYYDIFEYINKDDEIEQEKLKERLKEIIGENCKPYQP